MVHDTISSCEHQVTEATGRKDVLHPLLNILDGDVESRRDDTALVDSADKLDDDLARSVVIDDLEFTDVSVLLHNLQELDNDLGGRSDDDLALSTLLSVGKGLQAIG